MPYEVNHLDCLVRQSACAAIEVSCLRESCIHSFMHDVPLHLTMNGHCYDITHKRIKDSSVAPPFNHGTHSLADISVMVIDLILSHESSGAALAIFSCSGQKVGVVKGVVTYARLIGN